MVASNSQLVMEVGEKYIARPNTTRLQAKAVCVGNYTGGLSRKPGDCNLIKEGITFWVFHTPKEHMDYQAPRSGMLKVNLDPQGIFKVPSKM